MLREMLAPRAMIIFFILWSLVTAGVLYWNRASKDQHSSWLKWAAVPALSAFVGLLITFVIFIFLQS
jgi:hypothetical protein